MPKTRISCPNCRQPVVAEIDQLFDAGTDPRAKQIVLSGAFNILQCPNCRYQGSIASPIVYHDPQKELLLTFVPAELGLPVNEQERMIGPLINKVVNSLPLEKRKAYLLRPQTMFTLQSLIERILEADGITREMIQAQQQRLNLLQRLANASDDVIAEIAKQEDKLIDAEFFTLLDRLAQAAVTSGDENSAQRLGELQQMLLQTTTFGQEMNKQSKEVEAAVKSLQALGRNLTREKLLDLIIQAPNETRVGVIVSLTRPGLDYEFFRLLSERIDKAKGEEKVTLDTLREQLLDMTREIDKQMQARAAQAKQLLESLLKAEDITAATVQNLQAVDDLFVQMLNAEMEEARKKGDLDRAGKLQKVIVALQQASTPPPEIALIEEMLDAPDEQALASLIASHQKDLTPEFMEALTGVVAQTQSGDDPELGERIQKVYEAVLRKSMQANL